MQDIQDNLIRLKYQVDSISSYYDISPYLDDINYLLINNQVKLYNYPDKYISTDNHEYRYENITDIINILNNLNIYPTDYFKNKLKRKNNYDYNSHTKRLKYGS